MTWNQLDTMIAPPVVTADFVYIRLIGDRSIQEHDFGKIQKDRLTEMQGGANELLNIKDSFFKNIKVLLVAKIDRHRLVEHCTTSSTAPDSGVN